MSLRHALLGLLADRPASGYDLMKLFGTSLAPVWPATQSQVYGELARLNAEGLAEAGAEGLRGRREYTLTDAGAVELRRWLTGSRPSRPLRSDAMLGVFFLGVLTPEEAGDYLAGTAGPAARRAPDPGVGAGIAGAETAGREGAMEVSRGLALEYRLRLAELGEEWARWAAERVADARRGGPGS